jgi:hypothetical protein
LYQSFAAPALAHGLPYRLEETNNFTGGAKNASDTFAAALWALDYLHWWAARGAGGVNFHNRRWILNTTIYPISEQDDGLKSGYDIHPIAYGLKAFDIGGHGSAVPLTISNPDAINVTAYAVRQADSLFVTIINKKDIGDKPHDALVSMAGRFQSASAMLLVADAGEAAKTGITLGGVPIAGGSWDGKWTPLRSNQVKVPGAAAAIVKLSTK